jgi:hypothetical protein
MAVRNPKPVDQLGKAELGGAAPGYRPRQPETGRPALETVTGHQAVAPGSKGVAPAHAALWSRAR